MKRTMRNLAGSLLIALAPIALAQAMGDAVDKQVRVLDDVASRHGQRLVAAKIAANFENLAGSKENSLALVNALRNGTNVTLQPPATGTGTGTATGTTIDPATGKMGWGNVKIALGLAQDALLRAGITKPTAAQLDAALNGGDVTKADGTVVTLKGVLQMRAAGMGWGQIAQANGTKVGPVVSSLKSTQAQLAKLPKSDAPATGVTTAAGESSSRTAKGSSKGITSATGTPPSSGGLVTADGATSAHSPKGNSYGRGVVTAAGGGAGLNLSASGKPSVGAGVVTGSGAAATGVTTANANAGGKGNGGGNGNGKGKGG